MEDKTRLTVDISSEEYQYLKMACDFLGVSVEEFILNSAIEKLEALEDEWLAEKASQTLQEIDSGKEKLIDWPY